MRRILLVVAILLIATPAFATVTVNAVYKGSGVVEVNYACSNGEAVRAFALDINVNSPLTIDTINTFQVGDNNGYGIFPGKFRDVINPTSPNWVDPNYNPVAPTADAGAKGPLGTSAITIELGSLYTAGHAPGSSGTLCRLVVNNHAGGNGALALALNTLRGGVVMENGDPCTPTLNGTTLTFDCFYAGMVDGIGRTITAANVTTWTNLGKPACWCYKCHPRGDADNSCTITSVDILALRNAWPNPPINGVYNPCADTDYSGTITSVDVLAVRNAWPNAPINGPGCTGLTGGCP